MLYVIGRRVSVAAAILVLSACGKEGPTRTLQSVSITGGPDAVSVGGTIQYTAIASYSDGASESVTATATWSSSNSAVATVAAGVVTGRSAGTATISVTFDSRSASRTITIAGASVSSVQVTGQSALSVGQSAQWTATAVLSNGSTDNATATAIWASSNTAVASVSGGMVRGVGVGSADISATASGITGRASVVVAAGASLSISGLTSMSVGQSSQWTATERLADGSTRNVTNLASWFTANGSIAAVSPSGSVSGVAVGTAEVRAEYAGNVGRGTVSITAPVASFVVVPNADTRLPDGQCAVAQDGANNRFRCRFDASSSAPNSGVEFRWEIPVGGNVFTGAVLSDIVIPCTVGGIAGSGAIERQIRLSISGPGISASTTRGVTFIRASAC